jgi:transposase
VLEDAGIKLAGVASDFPGVSGRAMIAAPIAGEEDSARVADLAKRRLRAKILQLARALHGQVTEHLRFQLRSLIAVFRGRPTCLFHTQSSSVGRAFSPCLDGI